MSFFAHGTACARVKFTNSESAIVFKTTNSSILLGDMNKLHGWSDGFENWSQKSFKSYEGKCDPSLWALIAQAGDTIGPDQGYDGQALRQSSGQIDPSRFYIPEDRQIHITQDTLIDGHGRTLELDAHARIVVDHGVTLTLRNMRIKTTQNDLANPIIRPTGHDTVVALQDVELNLADDFIFRDGQLFIHDDVLISGTHAFSYRSTQPGYICDGATLGFERGSTFYYYPSSNDNHLIKMENDTAAMCFNGSTLLTSHTGMRLSKGTLLFDNNVTLSSASQTVLTSLTGVASKDQGDTTNTGYVVEAVDWSPDGNYVAVGMSAGASGSTSWYDLEIYRFDGSNLVKVASKYYGAVGVNTVAWSSDGTYLAVGTNPGPTTYEPGITAGHELRVYSFDGSTLAGVASKDQGSAAVNAIAWTTVSGTKYLAIGTGANPSTSETNITANHELRVYSFDGSTLTGVASKDQGSVGVNTVACTVVGGTNYVAIGTGVNPSTNEANITANYELRVYSFNGSTLAGVASKDQGAVAINAVDWSPNGNYLAVGTNPGPTTIETGIIAGHELRVYSFDGNTLAGVVSKDQGGDVVNTIAWSPDGNYVAIGTSADPSEPGSGLDIGVQQYHELRVYSFNGVSLMGVESKDQGATAVNTVAWRPDGDYLTIGTDENPSTSGTNIGAEHELRVYYFDRSSLTGMDSKDQGSDAVYTVAWSPDGDYVAIGTDVDPSTSETGITANYELRVYSFDGTSFTGVTSKDQGVAVKSVAWTSISSVLYLAVGTAANPTTSETNTWLGHELRVYSFDGSSLTGVFSKGQGVAVNSVAWTPDGAHLAIGTDVDPPTYEIGIGSGDEVRVYNFDTSSTPTLLAVDSNDQDAAVNAVDWTVVSSQKYLAVGTEAGPTTFEANIDVGHELRVYHLNVNVLDGVASKEQGSVGVNAVAWSDDGVYLAIGTDAGPVPGEPQSLIGTGHEFQVYQFDTTSTPTLFGIDSKDQGAVNVNGITWAPDGEHIALVTDAGPSVGDIEIVSGEELRVYSFDDVSLAGVASKDQGAVGAHAVAWNPTYGDYIAIGTDVNPGEPNPGPDGGVEQYHELRVYYLEPTVLDGITSNKRTLEVEVNFVSWSPDGKYLAIGTAAGPGGGEADRENELRLYRFDLTPMPTLVSIGYKDQGAAAVNTVSWSPNGMYLAVGTSDDAYVLSDTGIGSQHELQVYMFDTRTRLWPDLSGIASKDIGSCDVNTLSWSPDGAYLAVGTSADPHVPGDTGIGFGHELQVYQFDATPTPTVIGVTSKDMGSTRVSVNTVAWSPDGIYLAVGTSAEPTPGEPGVNIGLGDELQVYRFDTTPTPTLFGIASKDMGSTSTVHAVSWSPDGKYLAVGASSGASPEDLTGRHELVVYNFDGEVLTGVASLDMGITGTVRDVSWSPDGYYVAVGRDDDSGANTELVMCLFDGSSLVELSDVGKEQGANTNTVAWRPAGNYLAIGTASEPDAGDAEDTGIGTGHELRVYDVGYRFDTMPQSKQNCIIFGDSSQADGDLDVHILAAARVEIDGRVVDDSLL